MGLQLSWLERAPDKDEVDGSIPLRPTIILIRCFHFGSFLLKKTELKFCGCLAQLGEYFLHTERVVGSNPTVSTTLYAVVAQQAEQLTCNQQVGGSIPLDGTRLLIVDGLAIFFCACIHGFEPNSVHHFIVSVKNTHNR